MKEKERGSAAVLVLGVMVVLAILVAGVVPALTNEIKMSKINSDAIEAQLAAEAGIKRAIVDMKNADATWNWLGAEQAILTGIAGKTYKVTSNLTGSPAVNTEYTFTSVGTVNGVSRMVVGKIKYVSSGFSDPKFEYQVYAGRQVEFWKNVTAEGSVHGVAGVSLGSGSSCGTQSTGGVMRPIDLGTAYKNYPTNSDHFINTKRWTEENYYIKGASLIIGTSNDPIDLCNHHVTVYVDGPLTLYGSGNNELVKNGTIRFITTGANPPSPGEPQIRIQKGKYTGVSVCAAQSGDIFIEEGVDITGTITAAMGKVSAGSKAQWTPQNTYLRKPESSSRVVKVIWEYK